MTLEAGPEIVEQLRQRLLTGALPPGTRLAQAELAATFGVSRMPIRQALQALASEGLVELTSGATAVVTPLSIAELQELYEMREALEPMATRLAVPNVGRAEIRQMSLALDAMGATDVPAEFLAANAVFHSTLCRQANRQRLCGTIEHLRKLTDRYLHVHLVLVENTGDLFDEHSGILDAVAGRDGERADALTRQHLATSHDLILNDMLDLSRVKSDASPLART